MRRPNPDISAEWQTAQQTTEGLATWADDQAIEESQSATPSQTRDAAELLLGQLDYWRNLAARRKMRSELLAIRLAAAEKVCESATPGQSHGYVIDGEALDDWRLLVGGESGV